MPEIGEEFARQFLNWGDDVRRTGSNGASRHAVKLG